MKRKGKNLNSMAVILCASALILWLLVCGITIGSIKSSTENSMAVIAAQAVDRLESGSDERSASSLLQEDNALLEFLSALPLDNNLQISLISNGAVIATSERQLLSKTLRELQAQAGLSVTRTVGETELEVWVTAKSGYLTPVYWGFGVAALITLLLFGCMFLSFHSYKNRHYLKPLNILLADVEDLGMSTGALALRNTGEQAFDKLVEQVNQMLARLEERNNALFESKIELQKTELERQRSLVISLKKQINAHFAVNVLNHIKLLSEQGQIEQAGAMSDGLSFLLRYANAGDTFIDGMDELLILQKYVTVMENWMPGRFTVDFDWDDLMSEVTMPRMLVQPMIENAITHGFTNQKSGGMIFVKAVLLEDVVTITVRDNGVGMTLEAQFELLRKISTANQPVWSVSGISHVALPNIQRRVYSYYGMGYGLGVDSKLGEGTTVTLRFPANCIFE